MSNAVQIGKATPATAPLDLEALTKLGKYQLRSLANDLAMFSDESTKAAFLTFSVQKMAEEILPRLHAWKSTNGGAPMQAPVVQAPVVEAPVVEPAAVTQTVQPETVPDPKPTKRTPAHNRANGNKAAASTETIVTPTALPTAAPSVGTGDFLMLQENVRKAQENIRFLEKQVEGQTKLIEAQSSAINQLHTMVKELMTMTQAQSQTTRIEVMKALRFPTAIMFMMADAHPDLGALGRDEVIRMALEDQDQLADLIQQASEGKG